MVEVKREDFLKALEATAPGLSRTAYLEQSDCFVLRDGTITTFNESVCCRSPSPLDGITGAVSARKLLEYLRKTEDDSLSVEVAGAELVIRNSKKSHKARFRLQGEISLPTDVVDEPPAWRKIPPTLVEGINTVGQCASTDVKAHPMTCIHITGDWVEACDCFQVCRWPVKTKLPEPILIGWAESRECLQWSFSQWGVTNHWLHLKGDDGVIHSCRRYSGDYRELTPYLEVEGSPAELTKGLAKVIEKAAIFSDDNPTGDYVTVDLTRKGKIKITGEGLTAGFDGSRSSTYDGPPIRFMIRPGMLAKICEEHQSCVIGEKALKVATDTFSYVVCLMEPEGKS